MRLNILKRGASVARLYRNEEVDLLRVSSAAVNLVRRLDTFLN